MKAILINSKDKVVHNVQYNGDFNQINEFIGSRCFTIACYLENGDAVFVDDEGLLNRPQDFFQLGNFVQPVAGNALILGSTEDGDSTDVQSDVKEIDNDVIFMDIGTVLAKHA